MVIVYLDTSAALKLVIEEVESVALASALRERRGTIISSYLLHAELHCAAARRSVDVTPDAVDAVLSTVELLDVVRSDLIAAPTVPGRLRTADAIHLTAALRVGAETIVSYDAELNAAAVASGLVVLAPS